MILTEQEVAGSNPVRRVPQGVGVGAIGSAPENGGRRFKSGQRSRCSSVRIERRDMAGCSTGGPASPKLKIAKGKVLMFTSYKYRGHTLTFRNPRNAVGKAESFWLIKKDGVAVGRALNFRSALRRVTNIVERAKMKALANA